METYDNRLRPYFNGTIFVQLYRNIYRLQKLLSLAKPLVIVLGFTLLSISSISEERMVRYNVNIFVNNKDNLTVGMDCGNVLSRILD